MVSRKLKVRAKNNIRKHRERNKTHPKKIEVREWLKEKAVRAASKSGLDRGDLMSMRWVLTWKSDGRAKARLVLQGFTDARVAARHGEGSECAEA